MAGRRGSSYICVICICFCVCVCVICHLRSDRAAGDSGNVYSILCSDRIVALKVSLPTLAKIFFIVSSGGDGALVGFSWVRRLTPQR